VMEKCTFCSHRLSAGDEPACVTACPVGALALVPQGEPGPVHHPGLPELGLDPGLVITPKRAAAAAPEMPAGQPAGLLSVKPADRAGLRAEWPLLVFTYVAGCLVAWFASAGRAELPFHLPLFLLAGLVAMGVSTLHLGRPTRAWRAVLNFRGSWVSREIVFFSAFLASAVAVAWRGAALVDLVGPVTAVGFAALFSMDMVYRVRNRPSAAFPHSAMTTLSAAFMIGLLSQDPWLAVPAGSVKLALYLVRVTRGAAAPWPVVALRILAGFVWPLVVWIVAPGPLMAWLVAGPLIGEALDRAQFYAELRFPSPGQQIDLDLRRLLARAAA